MCSINFSNTGSNFREMVTKSANDKVISQTELSDLGKSASTDEEKNFVNTLQSKANFQDLKLASFDPGKSTIIFNLPEKSEQPVQVEQQADTSKTSNVKQTQEQHSEPARVNLITPLLAAVAMILGAFSGAANNETLNSAVNKTLSDASNSINKHETPVTGKVEKEENPIARQKRLMEGKNVNV